jgi:hypothetical protein
MTHGICNNGTGPCYQYSGSQDYIVGRIPANLTLTGLAGVKPNTTIADTAIVTPKLVKNTGIPFLVQSWLWVPVGVPPAFKELTPVVNPSGCRPPPLEDTNPAVCSLSAATSGRLEINAIVNGVPQTLRKNIGADSAARICSFPPLKDFWYITTQFSQIDPSHSRPHTGRDQAGPGVRGIPVYAAEAGTVVYAYDGGSAGNEVIVDSGGAGNSYYMHLDPIAPGLREGQQVTAGALLGYVGSTGESKCSKDNPGCDPAHLHFEQHLPGGPPYLTTGPRPHVPPPATKVEPCFF